ncbi:small multi-drug export protein [Candidatus Woesearchaeota archaeon]|nr:small multi-drug export protein [Candidatus Woesearchaeota archaeon]
MQEIVELVWITLVPFLELRASIPYGIIVKQMDAVFVFLVCIITNILLAPVVYLFLDKFVHLFFYFKPVEKAYHMHVERTQKKIHKYVEKYGWLGVALFIGVPLPGSGVYSAAIASYALGLSFKKFILSAVIGVLIAGAIVTLVTFLGVNGLGIFVKII